MWKYSQNLLRQVSRYKGRYFSITRPANTLLNKEVTQKFKLPENVLPSIDFLSGLDDVQQGKVARIIAELEVSLILELFKILIPRRFTLLWMKFQRILANLNGCL
jgi:hypothetical protein